MLWRPGVQLLASGYDSQKTDADSQLEPHYEQHRHSQ